MTRSTSTALGLALALTLSTGSVLMKHPSPEDKAPGGYSDIMIAADDNQPVIPPQSGDKQPTGAAIGTPGAENKGAPIPVPDQAAGGNAGQGSSATATTPAEESKGKPTIPQ
jgi:hypothetical protein